MSFINVLVLLLLIVGCVASPAEHKPTLPPPDTLVNAPEVAIPEDLREQVKRAEEIGRQLYYLDKVAAIATDVLLEHIGQSGTKEIAGYLPFRESDGEGQPAESWRVIFFSTEDNPRINYEVRVFAKVGRVTEFSKMDPPRNPPPTLLALFRVRQAAIAALPKVVQPINPVLLPGEAGEMIVYLLAGTTKPDVAVFGKHYRAIVTVDGSVVKKIEPMSKTILEVPTKESRGEVKFLLVSQVLTDWPLETHVFTSLLHKLPVFVSTRRGFWKVDGGKISLTPEKVK